MYSTPRTTLIVDVHVTSRRYHFVLRFGVCRYCSVTYDKERRTPYITYACMAGYNLCHAYDTHGSCIRDIPVRINMDDKCT